MLGNARPLVRNNPGRSRREGKLGPAVSAQSPISCEPDTSESPRLARARRRIETAELSTSRELVFVQDAQLLLLQLRLYVRCEDLH
jgi:hypothetical protein